MTATSLPIIDFGVCLNSDSNPEQRRAMASAIDKACSQHGTHSWPQFFQFPAEEKRKHQLESLARGYWHKNSISQTEKIHAESISFYPPILCHDKESTSDTKAVSPNTGALMAPDVLGDQNSWPGEEFRTLAEEYTVCVQQLANHVLAAISAGLGITDVSRAKLQDIAPHITFNGYQALTQVEQEQGGISVAEHADTRLVLDGEHVSLQIQDRDGKWHGVPPIPGAFVINVGSTLNLLTNGRYIDVNYRVVHCSTKSRVSVAVFFDPPFDMSVDPLPEFVTVNEDSRGHASKTYGKYYLEQFKAYFGS
ncbi:hypothetical protein THASP1DRAFT_27566 [Thamnocephalis sphaerospora]|uniref:Isopenicillin N synthase-like Fe(2+) 2OG dioxygenase domain-containing protein n=1 Tax=Thamnocephalis sphaerospora TaxID=78915 RepID=A0A4V1IXD1_9FUNG|nr:hypothetical protein THASP1DRAFT_27566 [Thamnocephalis sphaerospora]|eukprot:RKP10639.1 hypothetical protein THASP1DRAFT_27566 [Thamnocephalis sphaerospora]